MAQSGANGKTEENATQVVHIWDDPESRIHFLESVLKNKEWEAVVYHPTDNAAESTPLPDLEKDLKKRGYVTQLGQDEHGTPVLNIKKIASDAALMDAVKELGFAKGTAHRISNYGHSFGEVVSKSANVVKYAFGDSARVLSSVYLMGDLLLSFAGKGDSDKLKSLAGVGATLQSLVFIGYAKNGEEAATSDLNKIAKHADKDGQNLFDESTWQFKEEKRRNPLSMTTGFLKDHPIQIGSFAQIAGQVALMAAGARNIARHGHNTGAHMDIATGALSTIAWLLVSKLPQEIPEEDKAAWTNPKRLWQEISAAPNKVASALLLTNSLTGIAGGMLEKKAGDDDLVLPQDESASLSDKLAGMYKNGNKAQIAAYASYLIGDATMYFTESDDYGVAGASKAEMLSSAAEEFVKASPLVMGKAAQTELVNLLAGYLAERSAHEDGKKEKRTVSPEEIAALRNSIAINLEAKLPTVHAATNEVAGNIAGIIKELDEQHGEAAMDALCDVICSIDGVQIDKEELKGHVARQVEYASEKTDKPITFSRLQTPLQTLVESIPAAANASIADGLLNAVRPFTQTKHANVETKTVMRQQAQQTVGSHTAALAARQQNAQSPALSRS